MSTEEVVTQSNDEEVDFVELAKKRWPNCFKIRGRGPYAVWCGVDFNEEIYLFTDMEEAQKFADVTTFLREGVVDLSKDMLHCLPNDAGVEDNHTSNPHLLKSFFLDPSSLRNGYCLTGQVMEHIYNEWFYVKFDGSSMTGDKTGHEWKVVNINVLSKWIFFETAEGLQKRVCWCNNNIFLDRTECNIGLAEKKN